MATSLPFGDALEVAVLPEGWEIKASLFENRPCEFTVINYRDQQTHKVLVRVTSAGRRRFSDTRTFADDLRLGGVIVKVNDKEWIPPNDEFQADYVEDAPRSSRFTFRGSGDPLPSL